MRLAERTEQDGDATGVLHPGWTHMAQKGVEVVHVASVRPSRTRRRTWEHLRIRLTFQRSVVMGRYISVIGHREPGSIAERNLEVHWDAVICHDALVRFRRRVAAKRKQPWPARRTFKRHVVVVAAEALAGGRAPVNAYTVAALLATEELTVSRWYLNLTLKGAGWRPLGAWEYPKAAIGYPIHNWVQG